MGILFSWDSYETGKAAAMKKLDAVKSQITSVVKGVIFRISRNAGLFIRVWFLVQWFGINVTLR
jgi:hypothetical protein